MVVGRRQFLGRRVSAGRHLAFPVVFAPVAVVRRRRSRARGKLAASVSAASPVSGPASVAVVVTVGASHVGTGAPVRRSSVCGTSVGRPRRASVVGSAMVGGVSGTCVSARAAMCGASVGTSVGDASVSEVTVGGTRVRTMVSDARVPEVSVGRTGVRARTTEVWTTVSVPRVGASVSDTGVPVGGTSVARPGVSGTRAEIRTAVCGATVSRARVTKATMRHFVGCSRVSGAVVCGCRMCCAGSSRERACGCGSGVAHGRRPVPHTRCAVLRLRGTEDTSGDPCGWP